MHWVHLVSLWFLLRCAGSKGAERGDSTAHHLHRGDKQGGAGCAGGSAHCQPGISGCLPGEACTGLFVRLHPVSSDLAQAPGLPICRYMVSTTAPVLRRWHIALDVYVCVSQSNHYITELQQTLQLGIFYATACDEDAVLDCHAFSEGDRLGGWPSSTDGPGRVQSVALRLVCEREAQIESFSRREYWSVMALLQSEQGQQFEARLVQAGACSLPVLCEQELQGCMSCTGIRVEIDCY